MPHATRADQPFAMVPLSVLFDSSLSNAAIRLYALLVHYVGTNETCWPSQPRLARDMGASRSTVQRTLDELAEADLICVTRGAGRTCHYSLTCITHDAPPASPVKQEPASPVMHKEEPVEQEPSEEEVVMRQTDRPEPITDDWTPSQDVMDRAASDCEGLVNLDRSLRRFRNYHIEKGTRSRAWDHKFEAWVLNDLDKVERETKPVASGPDEFGMMPWQHATMNGPETRAQRVARIEQQDAQATAIAEQIKADAPSWAKVIPLHQESA